MVAARERPDVALEVRKKLDGNGIRSLRHEIALRHLQFIAAERPRSGQQLIARAGRENHEVGSSPLTLDTEARLFTGGIHADDVREMHVASRGARAVEQHSV